MSKGSKRRPGDDKAYGENYDKIFGKREPWYVRRDREAKKVKKPNDQPSEN